MIRRTSGWENFSEAAFTPQKWTDSFWVSVLLVAAIALFSIRLGNLPLRDWDEGTVAQVAREIWQAPAGSLTWLYPTIQGDPYFSKPPLIHWLIALFYRIGGVNEWTARLPGAMLTALSVPMLYGIGRELFFHKTPAVLAALVYLTFLPVVRHGRLAMLDGAVLCFFLLLLLCLLRTRRDLRWGLGVGIAFSLLCLTKGIVALLLGAIALVFITLDTPRLLTSGYVWAGVAVGCLPAIGWYWAQLMHYGQTFITVNFQSQSVNRIWSAVESNGGPPWYYLLEILKYSLPWLLFLPWGFRLTWEHRNLGWAKLVLVWVIGYLLVISVMGTKLPWYVLPVYPALALVAGVQLADIWNFSDVVGIRHLEKRHYPISWTVLFALVAIAGWLGSFYFSPLGGQPQPYLQLILMTAACTFTITAILVAHHDSQFILVLFWGTCLSLLLLVSSRYWIWELNEAYPVKPVAALIQQHTPPGSAIVTSFAYSRPSLNFYSDRRVTPIAPPTIPTYWQTASPPYLLIEQPLLDQLALPNVQSLGNAAGWTLVTRD